MNLCRKWPEINLPATRALFAWIVNAHGCKASPSTCFHAPPASYAGIGVGYDHVSVE